MPQTAKEMARAKQAMKDMNTHVQLDWLVYMFLDGDSGVNLAQQISVPPGHIHGIYCYGHAAETDHESVYWRMNLNSAIIYPTKAGNTARHFVPVVAFWQYYEMSYPVYTVSELEIILNAAPNDGCTFIVVYENLPMHRTHAKVPRSIYDKEIKESQYEVEKI